MPPCDGVLREEHAQGVRKRDGPLDTGSMEKRTERQNIHEIIERLTAQFLLVARSRVDQAVELEYVKLNGRPVRQYGSNLVEHAAKARLAQVAVVNVAA
ncbi:hypothetical protein CLE01_09530 [Cryobacterium levicorallinum]|nr:hypothetical protein CLE01_09530 [Cryobacterium levicorallinum]